MAKEPMMKNMGADPGVSGDKDEAMKRGGHKKRASGGGAKMGVQLYNAPDANETKEATNETPSFKRGGHKRGGMAEGKMEGERLDRRPRRAAGGKAGGSSPYSSASNMTAPETGMDGRGYESSPPAKK
jgi:hypothetical protein